MTRISRSLRRLVVVGAGTAVIAGGLIPLAATANAANVANPDTATSTAISPATDTETAGACNPYTVTTQANAKFDVQISQADANDAGGATTTIGFCSVANFTQFTAADNPVAGPNVVGGSNTCPDAATTAAGPPVVTDTAQCDGQFQADANGKLTFGVTSDQAGTMNLVAYNDTNNTASFDQADTASSTATKTWVADTTASGGITCTPASDTNPTSTPHNFSCQVNTASGTGVVNADIEFDITSGPDAAQGPIQCQEDATNATGSGGGKFGKYDCTYTNTGGVGTDQIIVWDDTANGNGIPDNGEASTHITKTWVNAAPVNSVVTLTCSPNPTNAAASACEQPLSANTETFTATVTAGAGGSPISNVVVNFTGPTNVANADANDTESLSVQSCTTDANGKCSTVLTDSQPSQNETLGVTASAPLQGGGNANSNQATVRFHNPDAAEARNITVAPKTATQSAGGVQSFVATVTDRNGSPVAGVCVGWTETGPGRFNNVDPNQCNNFYNVAGYQNTCTTFANGKCSVEVTTQSTESGAETITASLDPNSASNQNASYNYPVANDECTAPADKTFAADAGGSEAAPANAPGAAAGNCTDSGTVTWQKQATTTKRAIAASINCFSPRKHVLKCKVTESPAKSGLRVTFKRRINGHNVKIGTDFTNRNGVAKLRLAGLKSHKVWRVFAHVYATSTTKGANTNTDRTRIK